MMYYVRGYLKGKLLLETWNRGEASKDLEVSIWQIRIGKGTADKCEVLVGRKVVETYGPNGFCH